MYSVDNPKKGLDNIMLVWAEPFDQYGGNAALVINSGYTSAAFNNVNTTPGRSGSFCMNTNGSGFLIRPLDTVTGTLGQGVAIRPVGFTGSTNDFNTDGLRFYSAGPVVELTIGCMPDLSIGVYDRTNTLKGTTAPNQIIPSSWIWLEARAIVNSAGVGTGTAEVRINGVQKLVINNINLPNNFAYHGVGGFAAGNCNFDDYIVWNGLGIVNNTFMSDRRLVMCLPTANGATQNFTASAGSAFNCVNVIPPVDTTYIEGAAAGNVSDFVKAAIGVNSTDIAAVVVCGRVFKTDAGVASFRIGINSAGNVLNSAELFPGTTGAFYYFPVELDPNGNIPWTRTNADAALVRATRVT